jgi:hypothetical protein
VEALVKNWPVLTICGATIGCVVSVWISLAWAQTSAGRNAPLIVGQWKLNAEKSNLRLPPDSIEIRQYTLRPDGFLVGLLITVNAQGSHYLQFTAKSDEKDYPEYSDQITADMITTGKPTPRTYSEKIINDYVTEWTDKADGKVTAQGKKTISRDGKTLTITVDGRPSSQVRVYDRQ